ncbi:MAG: ComF family protein [Alphaproteobacteria bacterium]|nr:ComF family protein [Alphaproteobacteria bacterium]
MILFRQISDIAINTLFPPRCASCGQMVATQGSLCGECWSAVDFITAPLCYRCGAAFEVDVGDHSECMVCIQTPPPFTAARAVFRYEGDSRRLITGYKYYDRTLATPMFARWLARAGADQLALCDMIVPVPLHPWRLIQRRYNQSALLAAGLGKLTGKKVVTDALRRTRYTPQQAGLTREERMENVRGAFAPSPRRLQQIEGKSVALIDDVLTTGATLNACAEALQNAGAKEIYVLVLARTTLDDV